MSNKIAYVLELTREEATVLCLLAHSSGGEPDDTVKGAVDAIAAALEGVDRTLNGAQLKLWQNLDEPEWNFGFCNV